MPRRPYLKTHAAVATSGTTAYPSAYASPGPNGNWSGQLKKTGTGTGTIALQTNDSDEPSYLTDPTLNWIQHDFADAVGVTAGMIDIGATDPGTFKFVIKGLAARRVRVVVTNATGTMVITGWLSGN